MRKLFIILLSIIAGTSLSQINGQDKTVVFTTSAGVIKARLYNDVPNHTKTFINKAVKGDYNGALFTRVIKEFMIQGGSPDSKNAPAGARCGFGDRNSEILPELRDHYFHKKGALAAPRQNDNINPKKKSDMSQFFIVHGKVYTPGELDTLELTKNLAIRRKAMNTYYKPVKLQIELQKKDNPREYNKRVAEINAKVDSVIRSTPGHLLFTEEQRKVYTTLGGCPHLDGFYTIYGEVTEGFEVVDAIAKQPKDAYDRPKKDIRIIKVTIQ